MNNILNKVNQYFFSSKNLLGIIISLICVYWSFSKFDYTQFFQYFKSIEYQFFIIAVLGLIFSVLIRSVRWSLFLNKEDLERFNLNYLFKNQMIGYFGNNILPLRLGDLLRVFMMSKNTNISKSYLLGSIVLERFLDIASLFFLVIFFSFFYYKNSILSTLYISTLSNLGFYLLVLFVILIAFYLIIKNSKYLKIWDQFLSPIKNIKSLKIFFNIYIFSLLIWVIYLFNIKIISYSCGHYLSISDSLLLLTLTTLFMIIPSSPGMIGTFHASVIMIMTKLLDFPIQEASSFSIILHAYSYITYSFIGGYFFLKANIEKDNLK